MSRCSMILVSSLALIVGAAAASCRPTIALAEPQPAAADGARRNAADAARHDADMADLDAQLQAARKQLEAAAHKVAELSAQLSRPVIEQFMNFDWDTEAEHPRAIIGVQLDSEFEGPGAKVREVSPGGPAAEAGIRAGDVVVAVNGTEVKGENPARQVMRLMRAVKPDSKVSVRVLRDGSAHDYAVVARQGPNYVFASGSFPGPGRELLPGGGRGPLMLIRGPLTDMELATVTPQLGRYFGSDKGVLVVHAPADGALQLEDGDVILAIDGRAPSSGSHATRILGSYQPGEKLTLRIVRMHKTQDIETTVPERAVHRHAGEGRMRGSVPLAPPPAPPAPDKATTARATA
ncbi:MAG TPA: PDZ domain-containing protein [Steroidobacteraceae bacterium]|nr:PDZ domain-containing protein [Steroidobacteraceae bacterium]